MRFEVFTKKRIQCLWVFYDFIFVSQGREKITLLPWPAAEFSFELGHVFFRRTARHEHQTDAVVTSPPHWVDRAQGGCHPCSPPTCHIMQDMYSITVHLPMSHQFCHPLIQSSGFVVCWRNRRRRYETKGNTEQPPLEPAIFVKILWLWSIAVVLENDNTCPNW